MNHLARNIFLLSLQIVIFNAHAAFTIIDPVAGSPSGKRDSLMIVEAQKSGSLTDVQRLRLENIALRAELTRLQQYQTASFQVKNNVGHVQTQEYTFQSTGTSIHITQSQFSKMVKLAQTAHKVVITGFTDSTGSKAANVHMSRLRANSFKNMLSKRGIPSSKIHIQTSSGAYVATNKTATGRAKNRRIVVTFF